MILCITSANTLNDKDVSMTFWHLPLYDTTEKMRHESENLLASFEVFPSSADCMTRFYYCIILALLNFLAVTEMQLHKEMFILPFHTCRQMLSVDL